MFSVLWIRSYHQIPRICLWHFTWKDSRLLVLEASSVHISDAYNRMDKTSVWKMCNITDSDRHLSVHTLQRKGMTEDAGSMHRHMSDRQYPSDDCMEQR